MRFADCRWLTIPSMRRSPRSCSTDPMPPSGKPCLGNEAPCNDSPFVTGAATSRPFRAFGIDFVKPFLLRAIINTNTCQRRGGLQWFVSTTITAKARVPKYRTAVISVRFVCVPSTRKWTNLTLTSRRCVNNSSTTSSPFGSGSTKRAATYGSARAGPRELKT